MWDYTRSASRAMQSCRGLYVFSHDGALGVAPAHELLGRVRVEARPMERPARSFSDYEVTVVEDALPAGVTLTRLVG
jgi:CRISPR-associated protein Csd2